LARHSSQSRDQQSHVFAAAEDAIKITDRPSQIKGGERRIVEALSPLTRDLTKNSKNSRITSNSNGAKKRGANLAKKRSNGNKKRAVTKRGQSRNNGKKTRGVSNNKKNAIKKNRTSGGYGSNNNNNKVNNKPSGKKSNIKDKKKKDKQKNKSKDNDKPSTSSAGMFYYYPNFDVMACVADGMPPYYLTPMYFSESAEECCAVHFPGMVAECIIASSLSDTDDSGGYILAINQQTGGSTGGGSSWNGGGKSGKSGGGTEGYWAGTSTGGKSGKSGGSGKAGKSVAVEVIQQQPDTGLDFAAGLIGAALGSNNNMMLQSEEPTYYPSYMPTKATATYSPTTYIPTYQPTDLPTEAEDIETQSPTYRPSSSTYFPSK
jgi:hypothetical protein